jgi:DNA polymerase II small subunit
MNEEEIIDFYLDNDVLISPELLSVLKNQHLPIDTGFTVLNKVVLDAIEKGVAVSGEEFDNAIVLKEKHKNIKLYEKFLEYITNGSASLITKSGSVELHADALALKNITVAELSDITSVPGNIPDNVSGSISDVRKPFLASAATNIRTEDFMREHNIILVSSYNQKPRKWFVNDFVGVYASRYRELEKILHARQELQQLTSISRILNKRERENVAFVGVIYEKALTKAGNIMLTVEDPTGAIKVVVNHGKEELFKLAEELQLDETIGITGMCDKIVFANNLFIPDIPLTKELKKSPEEGYFVVIADLQVGNKLFLEKEFRKFLAWINGELGNEKQKDVASKVKYIFIPGDLVEGVGIYPGQEFDLAILDVKEQYRAVAEYLKDIPKNIPIMICPGNHDVGRMSEPQPPLPVEYAAPVLELPNIVSVSNPSLINISANPALGFPGLDVMMYHGGSFFYYVNNVQSIRRNGSYKRADLIMRYLLQRRHLAPSHTSTVYIPDPKKDPLLIDKVPDFLLSGHIHRASVNNYRNVTCINASCWVSKSEEQERRGLEPQPARAFIVDMQTREVKIMNFLSREEQEQEKEQLLNPDAAEKPDVAGAKPGAEANANLGAESKRAEVVSRG